MNIQSFVTGALLSAALLVSACSKAPPEPMPVKDTVFAPAVNQLDKARATQDVLDNANQNTDAALKQAE